MTLLCSAIYVAALYSGTITTDWHKSADISGPSAEVQTCKEGFGARVAFSENFVQAGPQFGYTIPLGDDWGLTLQVHGGLGYSNTHLPNSGVRQITKLNVGVSAILSAGHYSVKVGVDHMSNGKGTHVTNAGQDLWSVGVGYSF